MGGRWHTGRAALERSGVVAVFATVLVTSSPANVPAVLNGVVIGQWLVDSSPGAEVFLATQFGDGVLAFDVPVSNDSSLCGVEVHSQAIAGGGGLIHFSNAIDFRIGLDPTDLPAICPVPPFTCIGL